MTVKKRWLQTQKLTDVKGSPGAYEQWISKHGKARQKGKLGDRFDFFTEPAQANPDSLTEDAAMYSNSQLTKPQQLMGEAIEHLPGLQRDCYMLTMRQGMSFTEAGKLLKLSKSDVQGYRSRAVKFITKYCQMAMRNDATE